MYLCYPLLPLSSNVHILHCEILLFQVVSAVCQFDSIQEAVDTTVMVLQAGVPIARIGNTPHHCHSSLSSIK